MVRVARGTCSRARLLLAALWLAALPRVVSATTVYVTDDSLTSNQVSVIDPTATKPTGTITVPGAAKGIAFRPDGSRAYVATTGNAAAVSVIDTATRTVVGTFPVGTPDCDPEVAVAPDGTRVYVTGGPIGRVLTVLDATSGAVASTIAVALQAGGCSSSLAVSPSGDRVYVTSFGRTLWVVDPVTATVSAVDPGASLANGIAVSPDGSRVYASAGTEGAPGSVLILDAAGAPQGSIALGNPIPGPLAVLPGGTALYAGAFSPSSPGGPVLLRISATQGVVATIPSSSVRGLALSSDATRLYATTTDGQTGGLVVIDTASDKPVGTVPLGPGVRSVAVMPDACAGGTATACDDANPCTDDVCQSGGCRHTVVRDGTPCDPCDASRTCSGGACTNVPFACTPSAAVAYVPTFGDDGVAVLDLPSTHRIKIPVGSGPWGAAADERGGLAFITNRRGRSLSLVDGVEGTVRTVDLGGTPLGVAADPQSGLAYVANYTRDAVDVVAPNTATKFASIPVGNGPVALAVHPAGAWLYASNYLGSTLSVVDVPSQKVIATVPVGAGPLGIAVHPDGTRVYVANYLDGTVSVVGTAANQRLRTIRVGRRPFGVAVDPSGTRVFVSTLGGGTVTTIDAATAAVVADIAVGDFPFGLAFDPVTHRIGVATGGTSGRLVMLDPVSGTVVSSSSVGAVPVSLGQFIGARPGDCPPRPLQCDDANPATADTCSAAGCRHDPLPPTDGAPAGAAALADALQAASPGALGTSDEVARIEALVASIVAAIPPPPAQVGATARRKALRGLRSVVHLLARLAKQPDVQPGVADRLLDLARGASRLLRRLRV